MQNKKSKPIDQETSHLVDIHYRVAEVEKDSADYHKLKREIEKILKIDPLFSFVMNLPGMELMLLDLPTSENLEPRPEWAYWFIARAINNEIKISVINDLLKRLKVELVLERELIPNFYPVFSQGKACALVQVSNDNTTVHIPHEQGACHV